MNRALGLALLIGGVVLLIAGIQAGHSITSNLSQAFTGAPTDKVLYMKIGGIVAAIAGAVLLGRGSK